LVSVLSQVLAGNSIELILAAASVEGKLRMFVSKVIKFNEFSKQINLQDGAKSVRTNAVLFDMTFLMLCFITQKYGYQVNLRIMNIIKMEKLGIIFFFNSQFSLMVVTIHFLRNGAGSVWLNSEILNLMKL